MPGAGRVYEAERELAIRQYMDVEYAVRLGTAAALRVSRQALAGAVRAYREGRDPARAAVARLEGLRELLAQAMVYAFLKGQVRSDQVTVAAVGPVEAPIAAALAPGYARGIKFLRNRLMLTPGQMTELEKTVDRHVLRVNAEANDAVQRRLTEKTNDIYRRGLHVKPGIKELREEWAKQGLTLANRFQIEAIFRTQTQLAYAAGSRAYDQEPAIDEILWGYKYVTVGDDRVRDSHVALDGVTLPKEHPFWSDSYPPNGFSCRCQVIKLFRERNVVEPPTDVKVDGKAVRPGADKGFRFDPSKLINTGTTP